MSGTITKSIRVVVIGHASTRWRGAKTNTEADRLNQALSAQRATNVRATVDQLLRQLLPGVKILPDVSYPPNVHPNGVPLGDYGVGSREPVLNPMRSLKRDSHENERLNRSVVVHIEWASTEDGFAERSDSVAPDVPSKEWKGRVKQIWGVGYVGAYINITLAITNPHSGKTGTYSAKLYGLSLATVIKPTLIGDVGEPFTFTTKDKMIFKDFDDKSIEVKNFGIGVGFRVGLRKSGSYISFLGLGAGASNLEFDESSSYLQHGVSLDGFAVRGDLKLEKTDLNGNGTTSRVPYRIEKGWGDHLIVTFPTGRSKVAEIPADERRRLDQFVKLWSKRA